MTQMKIGTSLCCITEVTIHWMMIEWKWDIIRRIIMRSLTRAHLQVCTILKLMYLQYLRHLEKSNCAHLPRHKTLQ